MKTRKFTAGLLALAMLLSLVAIPGAAFADSTYSVVDAKNVATKAVDTATTFGYFEVNVTKAVYSTDAITIMSLGNDSLITDIKLVGSVEPKVKDPDVELINGGKDAKVTIKALESGSFNFLLEVEGKYTDETVSGDIPLNISSIDGWMSAGQVVIASKKDGAKGNLSATVTKVANIGTGTGNEVTVRFQTSNKRVFEDSNTVDLLLPAGFDFVGTRNFSPVNGLDAKITGSGDKLTLTFDTATVDRNAIGDLTFKVKADSRLAKFGEVKMVLKNNDVNFTDSSVVVGKYSDYGVTVNVADVKEFKAGKIDQKIANIVIEESSVGSLVKGRTMYVTFPQGVKVGSLGSFENNDVGLAASIEKESSSHNDLRRTIAITVGSDTTLSNKAAKVTLKDVKLNVAASFEGPIVAVVSGNAGFAGELEVANVIAPLTVTTVPADVKIGIQDQKLGKVIVKENFEGALQKDHIFTIKADDNDFEFNNKGKLSYSDDLMSLEIKNPNAKEGVLSVAIKREGEKAASFELDGMMATLNRSLPEGPVRAYVTGDTLYGEMGSGDESRTEKEASDNDDATAHLFYGEEINSLAKIVIANVTTPAPDNTSGLVGKVEFVIDAATYTVNGVEKSMDVAPFIQDGRTMLPVRFVAEALGVSEDNIIWDANAKTVTIMKGDRIAQMTIGSKAMVVNGVTVQMDTAAAIKDGRTVLPVRFAAQALGANIEWNDATRTVTIN